MKSVQNSVAIQVVTGKVGSTTAAISGVDPERIRVSLALEVEAGIGLYPRYSSCTGNNVFLLNGFAKKKKLKVGDSLALYRLRPGANSSSMSSQSTSDLST